jgi:hypothetical protein
MTKYLLLLCIAWSLAPTRMKTTWAAHTGGSIDTTLAQSILDSPLAVTDNKGAVYTITRFRFSYRRKSTYQDSTGKVDTSFQLFSKEFYNTPVIDTLWKNNIVPTLQVGETFYIDNVVARNAKGEKSLAPGLTFDIR